MKRRLALVCMLALAHAACDADPTELESLRPADQRSAGLIEVSENQFAVDFSAYEADQRLWEADWTQIARRLLMDSEPGLRDWRAQDADPSFTGRVAALLDPPLSGFHQIALHWDALPILEPPLEILTRFWLPPVEHSPRVGIAWFIQEPDATGVLSGFAIQRNPRGWSGGGSFLIRMPKNSGGWSTTLINGTREREVAFDAGGWIWTRIRHTADSVEGTIYYRSWQGSLGDEPAEWDHWLTSEAYGPHGGWTSSFVHGRWVSDRAEPTISGGAGLFVGASEDMNGVVPLWGAFTVGINGAPAPPPPGYSKAGLVLACEPERPRRGTEVTCTASTEPAGAELEVTEWRFTSEEGQSIPAPEGQGAIWAGDMVVSGTVAVEAIVDGEARKESVQVKVEPRDWHDGIPPPGPAQEIVCPASGVQDCPLDYPPRSADHLGQTLPIPPGFSTATAVGQINAGPNAGFAFMTGPPIDIVGFANYLNRILFEQNNKFWRDSECERSVVLSVVREHEDLHVEFFWEAVGANAGTINLNNAFEKLVQFEPRKEFTERARDLGLKMVEIILTMLANEDVIPPQDPRRLSFPKLECDLAF